MTAPAIYRTRITHLRRSPVHHYFEQRGYSWYVDLDHLPNLPRWLRPFATFAAADHFCAPPPAGVEDTLRHRVDAFLVDHPQRRGDDRLPRQAALRAHPARLCTRPPRGFVRKASRHDEHCTLTTNIVRGTVFASYEPRS